MHEQNPELQAAVQERVELGYSDEQIHAELRAAGYDDETIEQVIVAARQHGSTVSPASAQQLIAPGALLSDALRLCRSEYKIFLSGLRDVAITFFVAGVVLVAGFLTTGIDIAALESLGEDAFVESVGLLGLMVALLLFIGVMSRMITFAMQRTLQLRTQSGNTYFSNFKWSFRHIIAIFWLSILVSLTTQFGYELLLLPGIALAVYALFANYLLAVTEQRGIAAIISSVELVYGRWWGVFGRMLLIGLTSSLIAALVAAVLAAGFFLLSNTFPLIALSGFMVSLFGALWIGFSYALAAHVLLFESLRATYTYRMTQERTRTLRTVLIIAAVLGLLVSLFNNVQDEQGALKELQGLQSQTNELTSAYQALSNLSEPATQYYEQSGQSYEGVCSELLATLSYGTNPDCIDRGDRWALSVETESGTQLCVGSQQAGIATGGVQAANATCANDMQSLESLLQGEQRALKDRAQELRDMVW